MTKITDILDELGIQYASPGEHHHVRDGWIGVSCPTCPPPRGEKGRYRLGIHVSTGRCNCWVCGRSSLVSVIAQLGQIPARIAADLLKKTEIEQIVPKFKSVQTGGKVLRPIGVGPLTKAHVDYLLERDLKPPEIERLWKVKGIGISSELQWRLFIPIELNSEEVSWTTRSISKEAKHRYISAKPSQEKTHIKDTMYGIDLVRTDLLVVEGPTDAWKVGPGAVAMFGLRYTPAQVQLMSRFPRRVVCFDNEVGAQRTARELCDTLSLFPGQTLNICLDADDPGSASDDEIKKLRRAVFE